jgi:hemolysin activation/secretion protein
LPLQETTISGLTSIPFNKLRYGALQHSIVIAPDWTFDVTGNITKAFPGYTLSPDDINSESVFLGAGVSFQWIRQRQENLNIKLSIDGRNTTSDLLDTPFTRDRIRALRANATYDLTDSWSGYNIASFTLSRGLDILGSSEAGDPDLSRADAKPDFTKAELSISRLQDISANWAVLFSADSQIASGTLYSAEEFGYGGQAFGRAYDASEITGDQGVSGSIELRYNGFGNWHPLSLQPYAFYDIGTVWNMDISQPGRESGSSTGIGLRGSTSFGLSANLAVAQPLTRDVATPIYGGSGHSPRFLMQISQAF